MTTQVGFLEEFVQEYAQKMIEKLKEEQYFEKHGYASDFIRAVDIFNNSLQGGVTKDHISALNEYSQKKGFQFPEYIFDTSTTGDGFLCKCTLNGHTTHGQGVTKKASKTKSAANMCQKLHISLSGCKKNVNLNQNPITVLQELNHRYPTKFPTPVFEEKPIIMNQFAVMCSVGKVMKEGMGFTKKGAKINAAQKVLAELIQNDQTDDYNVSTSPKQSHVVMNADFSSSLNEGAANYRSSKQYCSLEELDDFN